MIAKLGSKIHQGVIKKFDYCFVPDYQGHQSLCPALSQNNSIQSIYLGPISRIECKKAALDIDILVILSGPEPQRTQLEEDRFLILGKMTDFKVIFVRGSKYIIRINKEIQH